MGERGFVARDTEVNGKALFWIWRVIREYFVFPAAIIILLLIRTRKEFNPISDITPITHDSQSQHDKQTRDN